MRALIIISIVIALVISVIPLPFEWRWYRPELMALIVIYWSIYSPQYFGVFSAWLCGILLDITSLSPLGYHSLGLIVATYISHLSYQRIRSYILWQQAAWVFILVGIHQLFANWVSSFMNKTLETPVLLITAVITAFLWPLLVVVLRKIKIRFRLS